MIRNIWNIPCLGILANKQSQQPSYIDIISGGYFYKDHTGTPMPPFRLVSRWEFNRDIEDGKATVTIEYPDKTEDAIPQAITINQQGTGILDLELDVTDLIGKSEGITYISVELKDSNGCYSGIKTPIQMSPRPEPSTD